MVLKQQERLNYISKNMGDNYGGSERISKVKPMYLKVKLKEAKSD